MRYAIAEALRLDVPVVLSVIERFLRDELRRTGLRRYVLGLSGGIDSALTCALAARAVGAAQVVAVKMPYRTSAADSLSDADAVIDAFGIQHVHTIDISPAVDAFLAAPGLPRDRDPVREANRRGNRMSRERMCVLYDLSMHYDALVAGTSNKTELLTGYGTLHGDMASALNPIGDLYKVQVYELAARVGVPESILRKAPTADLFVGQTDEAQLGVSYDVLDSILFALVDRRERPEALIARGVDPALAARVLTLVQRSQFKRSLPVIGKISLRTPDRDFRYPRDWGT